MVSLVALMFVARTLVSSLLASFVSYLAKLQIAKDDRQRMPPALVFATYPSRTEVWKSGTWTRATQKCTPLSMRRRDSGAHAPPKCKKKKLDFWA